MSMVVYQSIDQALDRKNRIPGYVYPSPFFDPLSERHQTAPYIVREGDKLLLRSLREQGFGTAPPTIEYRWVDAKQVVGQEYRKVVEDSPAVVALITPLKFEFHTIRNLNAYFDWGAEGKGFGQLSFYGQGDTVNFDTELLDRETVRCMLHQFVDHIIDTGRSDDWDWRDRIDAEAEQLDQLEKQQLAADAEQDNTTTAAPTREQDNTMSTRFDLEQDDTITATPTREQDNTMSTRFDLEQAIFAAWGTKDDISVIITHVLEDSNVTNDRTANMLIGLELLHELRMQKVFSLFERLVAEKTIS